LQHKHFFAPMEIGSSPERPFFHEGILAAQPIHRRCLVSSDSAKAMHSLISPKPVGTVLKDCAGLSVKAFALIVLNEDGEEKMYTSPSLTPHQQTIFTDRFRVDFLSGVRSVTTGGSCFCRLTRLQPDRALANDRV
jgi:hypothetical protein